MSTTAITRQQFSSTLATQGAKIKALLPEGMDAGRFARIAIGLLDKNKDLLKCSPTSFTLAVIGCAELGLEPLLGQAYIIPYGSTATLMIGYQGMVQLARNSGKVRDVWADVVRDGDDFTYSLGTKREIHHVRHSKPGDPVTHAYACADLGGGNVTFVVLDNDEIEARRKVSKSGNVWKQWPEEMQKKTAVRALWKMLPKSTQMLAAIELDNSAELGSQVIPVTAGLDLSEFGDAAPWDEPEEVKE
jgi:recombination protein RecT